METTMWRNNLTQLNLRCYEEQLSPFGRKVLSTLVKKWNTDHERKRHENVLPPQQIEYHHHRKKVLNFSDNEPPRAPLSPFTFNPAPALAATPTIPATPLLQPPQPPTSYQPPEISAPLGDHVIADIPFDFPHYNEDCRGGPAVAPTSAELVKTVHCQEPNLPNISSDNLVQTVLTNNEVRLIDVEDTVVDRDKDRFIFRPHLETNNNVNNCVIGRGFNFDHKIRENESVSMLRTRNVDWDNMFDTELLSDIDSSETTKGAQETIVKENTFEIKFHKSKAKKPRKPKTVETNSNKNRTGATETKNMKRKTLSKITDSIPKKIKKPELNFSKQLKEKKFKKKKYTEAVKDWLMDVDPQNTVEEDIPDPAKVLDTSPNAVCEKLDNSNKNVASASDAHQEIVPEKTSKEKSAKKVVQAQLANKDGVMKFAKPKKVKSKIDDSVANEASIDKNENVKEKKSKSKFVAPIKSQIPVKDITYDVTCLTEENIEDHRSIIMNIEREEIFMVLVYSNGFCQLNQQHTEDACAPEGVLACLHDIFYYFKLDIFKELMPHLVNNNTVISYDGKSLLLALLSQDVDVSSVEIIDAKIGGALIEPDNPPENFSELQKLMKFSAQFTVATQCPLQKAAWYTTLLGECVGSLKAVLVEEALWKVFVEIEMKLLPIITDMECQGVLVDMEKLKTMETMLMEKMKQVEVACHRAAGRPFQINSATQVRAILYDELHLDTRCNVRVRETLTKGAKSTSEAMLKTLMTVHPLPKLILEYRHLHKAHATFLAGIAQHVKDGVVRPTWVQTAAATGRIASNNPNLQAIPKAPFSLVMFPGPDDEEAPQLAFRSVYRAPEGWQFLAADFQHVECRVFAHAAADGALLDALRAGQDLFRVLAAQWLKKPADEVSDADRERTKRIVYASLYGAGARRLMEILDVPYDQALAVSASFNRAFPMVRAFGRGVVSRCAAARGRLRSLAGRARRLPHIDTPEPARRARAERQAVNFVVQGSAADLCKMAMIATDGALRAARPPPGARLVLQIHDELVWQVRAADLRRTHDVVRAAMESCGARCGLALPLPVALYTGPTWGDMRPYTPPPPPPP